LSKAAQCSVASLNEVLLLFATSPADSEPNLMGDQFYIKLAGRVRGPFTVDGLKEQIRRGVFSPHISEVSEDRTTWTRASQIPALTELSRPSTTAPPQTTPVDALTVAEPTSTEWYYTQHGVQAAATVPTEQLDLLIRQGTIALHDRIWNETMPDWVEVSRSKFAHGSHGADGQPISALTVSSATLGVLGYSVLMCCTVLLVLEMRRKHFAASENFAVLITLAITFLIGISAIAFGHLAINHFRNSRGNQKEHNWIIIGLTGGYTVLIVTAILTVAATVSAASAESSTTCVEAFFSAIC